MALGTNRAECSLKRDKAIRDKLKRHQARMNELISKGWLSGAASKQAYNEIQYGYSKWEEGEPMVVKDKTVQKEQVPLN